MRYDRFKGKKAEGFIRLSARDWVAGIRLKYNSRFAPTFSPT
jgi:hypothetical protein